MSQNDPTVVTFEDLSALVGIDEVGFATLEPDQKGAMYFGAIAHRDGQPEDIKWAVCPDLNLQPYWVEGWRNHQTMTDSEAKIKCYSVRLAEVMTLDGVEVVVDGGPNLVVEDLEEMDSWDDMPVGEVYTVRVIEMTRAELDALPDFGGF